MYVPHKPDCCCELTYSAPCEESAGLRDESVDEGLTPLPQVDGDAEDVADEAERRERAVQEQREQTAVVLVVCNKDSP